MNPTIAVQMVGADFLKLRKKRGTLIWALVLTLAPLIVYFIVKGLQHSSSPAEHGPAGGIEGFKDAMPVLALFFGPLAAIMIAGAVRIIRLTATRLWFLDPATPAWRLPLVP